MSDKNLVMLGMIVGSIIGGYTPVLFGISAFSFTSVITSAVGGLIGVFIAYKFTDH